MYGVHHGYAPAAVQATGGLDASDCIWHPDSVLSTWIDQNQGSAFQWCPMHKVSSPIQVMFRGATNPYASFHASWKSLWPGYRCLLYYLPLGYSEFESECDNVCVNSPTNVFRRAGLCDGSEEKINQNFQNGLHLQYMQICGSKLLERGKEGNWSRYSDTPGGGPPYAHGYQITINTTTASDGILGDDRCTGYVLVLGVRGDDFHRKYLRAVRHLKARAQKRLSPQHPQGRGPL